MAQLMAALRGQFRQTATRGWAVSGHCRALQFVPNRSLFEFTGSSHFVPRRPQLTVPTIAPEQARGWRDLLALVGYVSVPLLGLWVDWRVRKAETRRNQLAHVNDQLAKLYGPLYGNRLATRKTYEKVLSNNEKTKKDYSDLGLKTYLEDAREEWQKKGWFERWRDDPSAENRGRSMLTRWRRFLLYNIHPLDLQAEEIVRNNAHLIDDSEKNSELFRNFVFHVNYQTFIVAKWEDRGFVVAALKNYRDGDFDLWSNSGTLEEDTTHLNQMLLDLETHVNETYKKLVKRQKQLMEGLEIEG
ncbi:uncharacterized protein [Branchiostoma lanceolatum]|uniref:Hypp1833 protein n=1 Tax=Branchiostoma lanceolatum TaxID=7740 RepID=A0A8J9ZPV7_BRALA|nr:Hypp1833 [Branchiostoma lanceolatum]